MENDKKRTRSMYENDTGPNYYTQGHQCVSKFTTPANWTSSEIGPIFDFGNSVRDNSCYQFGNPCGNYSGEDSDYRDQYQDWQEDDALCDGNDEWGREGEDWVWACTDCGREVQEGCECSEVCEACNQEWDSCYCKEAEGYDSVG